MIGLDTSYTFLGWYFDGDDTIFSDFSTPQFYDDAEDWWNIDLQLEEDQTVRPGLPTR